jgi:phosphatidylserine decarboxylase
MISSAKERGNKVMYTVVYLSPGDYHRYHSPAVFTANYRRHIAGYLEPVDPRYLKRHKDVLKSNERVNVLGDWAHGFFAISFVGATNVGSIKINFDDTLRTNYNKTANPKVPCDRNYTTLSSDEGACRTYPVRNRKLTSGMLSTEADE